MISNFLKTRRFLKGLFLSAAMTVGAAAAAQAASVSFFMNAPIMGGPFDTVLLDFIVTYDDAALPTGDGYVTPENGLVLDLIGIGPFESVDVDYPQYPRLYLSGFVPTFIDFLIDSTTVPELGFQGISAMRIGGEVLSDPDDPTLVELVYDEVGEVYWTITTTTGFVSPVPLPAGMPLLAGAVGMIALAARRRKAA